MDEPSPENPWAFWQARYEWASRRWRDSQGGGFPPSPDQGTYPAGPYPGGGPYPPGPYAGRSYRGGPYAGRSYPPGPYPGRSYRGPGRRHHHGRWRFRPQPGPIRRSHDERLLGGVAGGLAKKCGLDPNVVRLGFVIGALMSGFGVAIYVLAWLLVPSEGETSTIAARAFADRRGIAMALAFLPVMAVALLVGSAVGAGWIGTAAAPLCVGAAGLILVWRNVGDDERSVMERLLHPLSEFGFTGRGATRLLIVRSCLGAALVVGGAATLLAGSNSAVLRPLLGVFLVVAGAVVVFGPWWLKLVRDLIDERQARALAEERADMAARVHDSVLQTLALIQRRASEPQQVVRLARAQERELRSWLFEGHIPGADAEDATIGAAVQRIQQDVEALHQVPVDAVMVGDCPLDDDLRSLVEAGREATVNGAKWSGAPIVSLYVEVQPAEVAMFVRDRGAGFEMSDVAPDRRGLSDSIVARMERHGGRAAIRSTPGVGTEVVLTMPRRPARTGTSAAAPPSAAASPSAPATAASTPGAATTGAASTPAPRSRRPTAGRRS